MPCLLDIVIGCDVSGSMALGGAVGANNFVREFVTNLDAYMNGSIAGIPGSSSVQVGTFTWSTLGSMNVPVFNTVVVRQMTDNSSLIESDTNITAPITSSVLLGVPVGGGDDFDAAIVTGMSMLNSFGASALGNRSNQPNYRRIMIIVTDSMSPNNCTTNLQTNMSTDVWNVGSLAGSPELDVEVFAYQIGLPTPNWQSITQCLVPPLAQTTNIGIGTGVQLGALGTTLADTLCFTPISPLIKGYKCNYNHQTNTGNCQLTSYGAQYYGPTALQDCQDACQQVRIDPREDPGLSGGPPTSSALCDPLPPILANPEFCPQCDGGFYDANGGWGGTTRHPACKCCLTYPWDDNNEPLPKQLQENPGSVIIDKSNSGKTIITAETVDMLLHGLFGLREFHHVDHKAFREEIKEVAEILHLYNHDKDAYSKLPAEKHLLLFPDRDGPYHSQNIDDYSPGTKIKLPKKKMCKGCGGAYIGACAGGGCLECYIFYYKYTF
jgi:hypothetical protein